MSDPIVLRTERTILRTWRDADRATFAAMNADPAVMEHFPEPLTRRASDDLADSIRRGIDERGWGLWALELPGVAEFAGFVGLNPVAFELPVELAERPAMEIGWRLARSTWGHGYASEAATAALDAAFDRLGRAEVVSFTTPANERSQRVMRAIGLHRDPGDDFVHPRMIERGFPAMGPHVLYRITSTEHAALIARQSR
ncbi:MAG: GNAT family N-acetyltransferase [Actinomycetota bacterium]|nr:GNAT family N-acetyltransferase [Actinomycetota bacterium]